MTDPYADKILGGRSMVRDQSTGRVRNRKWPWPWDVEGKVKPGCERDALVTRRAGKKAKAGQLIAGKGEKAKLQKRGGPIGKLPSDLRQKLRESAADKIRALEEIAMDKRVVPSERIRAIDVLLRYGLGPAVEVSGPDRGPIEVEAKHGTMAADVFVDRLALMAQRVEEARQAEVEAALRAAYEKGRNEALPAAELPALPPGRTEPVEPTDPEDDRPADQKAVPRRALSRVIPMAEYSQVCKPATTFTPPYTTSPAGEVD
jgi:hypothetical protein